MISRSTRARLRLIVVAVALVPLALIARLIGSDRLSETVQRTGAKAWKQYDAAVKDAGVAD
jgi:hypothetical protein